MIRGLYRSATGMIAQELKQDNIANDLANANTAGYKREESVFRSFPDQLIEKIGKDKTGMPHSEIIGKSSGGVVLDDQKLIFENGKLQETGNKLNFALQGEGFFTVNNENEGVRYTRNGEFHVDGQGYLVTSENQKVMGEKGPILIHSENVQVSSDGTVIDNKGNPVDKLKIASFANPESLQRVGDNQFATSATTRSKTLQASIKQGFIETSNVNLVKEMINMIEVTRSYEANQKALKAQDELLSKAVNEVGAIK